MAFFSLVYDNQTIRLAVRSRGFGYRTGEAKLLAGTVADGVILQPGHFRTALHRALSSMKLSITGPHSVIAAIPESRVFTKIIELPPVPRREIKDAVAWRAREFLPADSGRLVVKYQLLSNKRTKGHLVLVTAAPREVVDTLSQVFEGTRMSLVTVVPRSTALAQLTYQLPHTPELLVEIEDDNSINLIVTKNRTARFSTSLAWDRKKHHLIRGIEQAVHFYEARDGRQRQIHSILLLPHPNAKELFLKLTKEPVVRPVQLLHPYQGRSRGLNDYLVNIGLLEAKIRLNLLAPESEAQLQRQQLTGWMRWLLVGQLVVLGSLILTMGITLGVRDTQIENISRPVALSANQQERLKQWQQIQTAVGLYASLEGRRSDFVDDYQTILAGVPAEVTLASLEYKASEKAIIVTGHRTTRESLATFARTLLTSFRAVDISTQAWAEEVGSSFTIKISVT